ncbi:hypothetical protein D1BOALGB6SA_2495 [Olavius sp. associated proteobacterium Delta 1]|nr:hypothetical protein D1BOALGB6SA_2495 [Olavius sp. associated proteobacterium Delta 1]
MSTLREQLRHEKRKREIRDRLEKEIRDELKSEGFYDWTISLIIAAAIAAIVLIVAPEPTTTAVGAALIAILIVTVAGIMMIWGVDELSISSIESATSRYGEREDREDEQYVANMESLGAE